MIKAVIFDAGDLVYYRDDETLKLILDFLMERGHKVSAKQFIKAYDEYALQLYKNDISKDEHLKKTLEYLKIEFDGNFFNEFAAVFRQNFSNIKIKENAHSTFEKIKSLGIKIGILTDTATTEEKKWEWFKKIGLAQFVDVIVCSSVTGYTKDRKESYEAMLKKLNVKSFEAIFVGHKEYEMRGAKLAGIKSACIEKSAKGDHYIKDISEIIGLVKKY
ncbi:HAD family hydrolase [Candidatus Woesearchaeota archaeon]|nr:HAD family hydrolase [Candidatus Woesearchaeota archaeon]